MQYVAWILNAMEIRHFSALLLLAAISTGQYIKTPRLKPGDTVGFITPASYLGGLVQNFTQYRLDVGKAMAQLGVNVKFAEHAFGQIGYFSGTDEVLDLWFVVRSHFMFLCCLTDGLLICCRSGPLM